MAISLKNHDDRIKVLENSVNSGSIGWDLKVTYTDNSAKSATSGSWTNVYSATPNEIINSKVIKLEISTGYSTDMTTSLIAPTSILKISTVSHGWRFWGNGEYRSTTYLKIQDGNLMYYSTNNNSRQTITSITAYD